MLRLQRYDVKVHYKKGTSLVLADTLSRATQSTTNDSKQTNFEVFRIILSQDVETDPGITSKTMAEVKIHTSADTWSKLQAQAISQGWPEHKTKVDPTISPYWTFRDELTINDGVVYKGLQVVIPVSMRTSCSVKFMQCIWVLNLIFAWQPMSCSGLEWRPISGKYVDLVENVPNSSHRKNMARTN